MEKAALLPAGATRSQAWAAIDRELVEYAAAVPEDWDKEAQLELKNVLGVGDQANVGSWDYDFTSLK